MASVAREVEGLSTSGPMGTVPTITVGGIVSAATVIITLISSSTGWEPPLDVRLFFDQYGMTLAAIAASLITSGITYFRVFSPRSVGEIKAGVR